jgi:colanic acid/amylovoran biosynthesis glycosyltransferase
MKVAKASAIAVYRDRLLPSSETFVRAQSESLRHFLPYYLGSRYVPGLSLPADRTLVANRGGIVGKVREASHQLWGWEPAFMRRVRKLNPILIHAHFGPDGVRALPLARALRVPLLVTFHGYDATVKDEYARRSFYSHRVYIRRREMLKQEARLFIAVSEFIREKLLEQGFAPDKVVVHYIGVDTEIFRPDPAVTREPVVLFIGRLVEKKGCEYLIRAMGRVQKVRPEVEMVVIGDGPLRPTLERLAKETLYRYRFLGTQPPVSVRAWMNRARIFSVPSITADSGDSEAFGLVFAEAQAMELPVVSFASGGVPEAVAHAETGFLMAERDWNSLADHVLLLLENDTLRNKFGAAGRRRVHALFNLRKQVDSLEGIYERVLSEAQTTSVGFVR